MTIPEIRKNIPLPRKAMPNGRKSERYEVMQRLEVGDSIRLDGLSPYQVQGWRNVAKNIGIKIAQRQVLDEKGYCYAYDIWRVA